MFLQITDTGGTVRHIDLGTREGEWLLGRSDSCDVCLPESSVSRKHAKVFGGPETFFITDLGSGIGTKNQNGPIQIPTEFAQGDTVSIGPFQLRLVQSAVPPASRPPALEPEGKTVSRTFDFDGVNLLYTDELMALKSRIHNYVLGKLNLQEIATRQIASDEMREKLLAALEQSLKELRHELPHTIPLEALRESLLDELTGYGPISPLLRSDKVDEIMVNGPNLIFVESHGRIYETGARFFNEKHLNTIIQRIVEPLGRHIDEASPMVDARLPDGSRVNAIIPPLSLRGASVTIRKFAKRKLTAEDLIAFGSMTPGIDLFLREAVRAAQNILVSGGTGSGKTTLLNVLSQYIPPDERVITIEDSAELKLSHRNLVSLESRPANIEGKGRIQIRDLVINALRMRPDRIIVGECRGAEALDMLQAMNTGHDGSLTTCHANAPRDAISRLENMVLMSGIDFPVTAIREQIASAINLIIQQNRLPDGSRKIVQISEITGREKDVVLMHDIFVFKQTGYDENGKIVGEYYPTGNVPAFVEKLRQKGDLRLDMSVFVPRV